MKSILYCLAVWFAGSALLALALPSPVFADTSGGTKVFMPFVAGSGVNPPGLTPTPPPSQPISNGWLAYVNAYRAAAGLPALAENAAWSDGDAAHAKYTVMNNVIGHNEDSSKPYYTVEGDQAAQNSNVMSTSDVNTTDRDAIDMWMQGPFHALGILDPRLTQTGFGSYRDPQPKNDPINMAAAMDVLRGLNGNPGPSTYPVMWPGKASTVSLAAYTGNESPNPLAPCSGYTAPTGLPIILQLGSGSVTPHVTAYSIAQGATQLASCLYDETTYTADSTGKAILSMRDAVVLIPRAPLEHGKAYTVSITNSETTYSWSFTIAN